MSFKVETTAYFDLLLKKLVKKFPSLKNEIDILIDQLSLNPELGAKLGLGIFKIRIKIKSKNKGKRGGARVISYVYYSKQFVYLLNIYDKTEKEDISLQEIQKLIKKLNL